MSKKELAASVFCWKPIHALLKSVLQNNNVRILAYHRICSFKETEYPFDEELISASVEQFEQQMHYVSENYSVLNFHDLLQVDEGTRQLPENPLVITFDDGYADNYLNAFPILKKYNLTAVFYVSTDYLETRNPFWFEQIIYCGKKQIFNHEGLRSLLPVNFTAPIDDQLAYAKQLRWQLMNVSNRERLAVMERIESIINEKLTDVEFDLIRSMSWDNVCEMANAGMEIGSHTKSHLILTQASPEEFVAELSESKSIIEERVRKNVVSISYPVGNENFTLSTNQLRAVEEAGYRWGISYVSGCDNDYQINRYSLKRLKIERYTTFNSFRAKLMIPDLFK